MLAINNEAKFKQIISEALAKSANYPRWQNAINKAVVQIELHGEFMEWQPESKSLLIWSQDSNAIYAANGVCECKAFQSNHPCWHRAAARLVRLYMEAETAKPERLSDYSNAPYLKMSSDRKTEKIGNVRI